MSARPQVPITPTLAALRQEHTRRNEAQRRWTTTIALVAVALVIVFAYRMKPSPGIRGTSLAVTIAMGLVVAGGFGVAALLGRSEPDSSDDPLSPLRLPVCLLLLVGSGALMLLQLGGAAIIGLVVGVAVAARLMPGRPSTVLFAVCLVFVVAAALVGQRIHHTDKQGGQGSTVATQLLALAAVYTLSGSNRRIRQQEEQARQLLTELEETRGAELRAAELAERQRLAREMHDVLAHSLSGLTVQLEGARLLAQSDPADSRLAGTIDRAHQLSRSGLDEARRAISMLRDDLPDPAHLAEAFTSDTGIPCRFTVAGQARELGSAIRLALYRVTQEALTNARKHAHPDRVDVRLEYRPDAVSLIVEDFAAVPVGGPPSPAGPATRAAGPRTRTTGGGYGLTGMRERAELLGGSLTAEPTGGGFLVQLRIPA